MLDSDLAELNGVERKVLNQIIGRNIKRFPSDLCFKRNRITYIANFAPFATFQISGLSLMFFQCFKARNHIKQLFINRTLS
jgi:hypothetical protein